MTGSRRGARETAAGQLGLFGAQEAVVVRRSARARRLALRVFPHGLVEVVVPPRTAQRHVDEFVRSQAAWIAEARRQLAGNQSASGLDPPAGFSLPALGESWEVRYLAGERRLTERATGGGGRLALAGPADPDWQRGALRDWLKTRARERLLPWLEAVSRQIGLRYSGATVRRQRSRWGSCSADRRISLNCALLFLDPRLVRYLFVHELCHTRHLNHSTAFWRLVRRIEPDFQRLEARLTDAWRAVPAWVTYDPPT